MGQALAGGGGLSEREEAGDGERGHDGLGHVVHRVFHRELADVLGGVPGKTPKSVLNNTKYEHHFISNYQFYHIPL